MHPPLRYAAWGVLWGLGAPLGSLLLRFLGGNDSSLSGLIHTEFESASYYYAYMTIGTTVAFASMGYVLGRLNEDLDRRSRIDGLTRVYNHRSLQDQLTYEIGRSDRYSTPLTCLMMDIDNFKQVNDRYGHLVGDAVLMGVARSIQEAVRLTDIVGRYGGEEFLVIMPQTSCQDALPLSERILKTVSEHVLWVDRQEVHVTLSVGVATYPDPGQGVKTKTALLSAADQAMYRAKMQGKNQVVAWQA
jgi:two-component system cell cycle response regulator